MTTTTVVRPDVTVTLAPNDAETFLTIRTRYALAPRRLRVTARPPADKAPDDRHTPDVFDVDTWTQHGWTRVLTALDGRLADSVEDAAVAAWHVLDGGDV